jgi:chromosome segregation ATPase
MDPTDVTIAILKDIRDEVRRTNDRLDGTNERIDQTNERLDKLERRVVESEIRTSTAITELAGTVRDMTQVLRASHDLRPRVERCEQDIAEIKRSIGAR